MTFCRTSADKDNDDTIEECLVRLGRGDREAAEPLYTLAAPSVYGYALSILKNRHDAEDVLHDCFIAVMSAAGSYNGQGKPLAWMLTVARNLALDRLRKGSRCAEMPDEGYDAVDPGMSLEDRVTVNACLTELSDEEREIVLLHAVSGFRHREIAAFLDLPLPTVLSKYHRALNKLRRML